MFYRNTFGGNVKVKLPCSLNLVATHRGVCTVVMAYRNTFGGNVKIKLSLYLTN
jgi:hypothetical protein